MPNSLLPPNATVLEQALEIVTARATVIDTPIAPLWNPATCPSDLLPWLAWGLSVDTWEPWWTDAMKRQAIADSITFHRRKGTRWAVETVLTRIDALAEVVEWHESDGTLAPHTFEIRVPLDAASGDRALASVAEHIIRDVVRVKPLREHLVVVQSLRATLTIAVHAVARALTSRRDEITFADDRSQPWDALLQTEDGEPLEADNGTFLDTTP